MPRAKHPPDYQVLKQLGIVERSRGSESCSSLEGEHLRKSESRLNESTYRNLADGISDSDDEDTLFDQTKLLGRNSRKMFSYAEPKEPKRVQTCRIILAFLAFLNIGMSLSIVGPTLPDIQAVTERFHFAVSLISANAFGAIVGLVIGTICYRYINPLSALMVSLLCLSVLTLIIPWSTRVSSLNFIFMLQGFCLGMIESGGYSLICSFWRRSSRIIHVFYTAFAIGGLLATLFASPFVTSQLSNSTVSEPYRVSSLAPLSTTVAPGRRMAVPSIARSKREAHLRNDPVRFNGTIEPENGTLSYPTRTTHRTSLHTSYPKSNSSSPRPEKGPPALLSVSDDDDNESGNSTTAVHKKPTIANGGMLGKKLTMTQLKKKKQKELEKAAADQKKILNAKTSVKTSTASTRAKEPLVTRPLASSSALATPASSSKTIISTVTQKATSSNVLPLKSSSTSVNEDTSPSAVPTGSTRHSTSGFPETGPGATTILIGRSNYWDLMAAAVSGMSQIQFAYLFTALTSLLSSLAFVGMCCFMPCRTLRRPKSSSEEQSDRSGNFHSLQSQGGAAGRLPAGATGSKLASRYRCYVLLVMFWFGFFVTGVDSVLYNLLPVYIVVGQKRNQSSGVMLLGLYWLMIMLSRLLVSIICLRRINQVMVIVGSIVISLVCSALLAVIIPFGWSVLGFGIMFFAIGFSPLFPHTWTWLDGQLSWGQWEIVVLLVGGHTGRMVAPVATAAAMKAHSANDLLFSVVVLTLTAGIFFAVGHRLVKRVTQLSLISTWSNHISGTPVANGTGGHAGAATDDPLHGEFELGALEDEDDGDFFDDTIHFDRTREFKGEPRVATADDGVFGSYFVKTLN